MHTMGGCASIDPRDAIGPLRVHGPAKKDLQKVAPQPPENGILPISRVWLIDHRWAVAEIIVGPDTDTYLPVGFVKTEEAAKRVEQAYLHYFENTKTIVVKTQFGLADAVRDPIRRMVVEENKKLLAILHPLE